MPADLREHNLRQIGAGDANRENYDTCWKTGALAGSTNLLIASEAISPADEL